MATPCRPYTTPNQHTSKPRTLPPGLTEVPPGSSIYPKAGMDLYDGCMYTRTREWFRSLSLDQWEHLYSVCVHAPDSPHFELTEAKHSQMLRDTGRHFHLTPTVAAKKGGTRHYAIVYPHRGSTSVRCTGKSISLTGPGAWVISPEGEGPLCKLVECTREHAERKGEGRRFNYLISYTDRAMLEDHRLGRRLPLAGQL